MNDTIAYCGLDCEGCDARIATANNDDALREKVAKLWSELNGVPITPDMIFCVPVSHPSVRPGERRLHLRRLRRDAHL